MEYGAVFHLWNTAPYSGVFKAWGICAIICSRIQTEYRQNTDGIQTEYRRNTDGIQKVRKIEQNTSGIRLEYGIGIRLEYG